MNANPRIVRFRIWIPGVELKIISPPHMGTMIKANIKEIRAALFSFSKIEKMDRSRKKPDDKISKTKLI